MNSTLNSKFQEDYKKYSSIIANIADGEFQKEAQALLNSLTTRVRNVEKMHLELLNGTANGLGDVGYERSKIIELRKLLDTKLKKIPKDQ